MELKNRAIPLIGEKLWNLVEKSHYGRVYHNLDHLNHFYQEIKAVEEKIEDIDSVILAICFHDIVYDPMESDNEERSAEKAKELLGDNERVIDLILATKNHKKSDISDINYFVDADMAILGQSEEVYTTYYKAIRKEFSMFPDTIYNQGRIMALYLLKENGIYKTDYFIEKYEIKAIENIEKEILTLKN